MLQLLKETFKKQNDHEILGLVHHYFFLNSSISSNTNVDFVVHIWESLILISLEV